MEAKKSFSKQPLIEPRIIRGVTVPNRAADCAIYLRKSALRDGRLPSVPEVSDALGVSKPAVVQLENTLRKRDILRGSHRARNLSLVKEILIPDSAVVALVASTLLPVHLDQQPKENVYTDADSGPWEEGTYKKIIRDRAGVFGFDFENLHDVPELVKAGYLQGKPGCFRLNKKLWDRDKVIFIKSFQKLKPGRIGEEEEKHGEALFDALVKAVGGSKGATWKQSANMIFASPDPENMSTEPNIMIVDFPGSKCQETNEIVSKWADEFVVALQKVKTEVRSLDGQIKGSKDSSIQKVSDLMRYYYGSLLRSCTNVRFTRWFFTTDVGNSFYLGRFTENGNWIFEPAGRNEIQALKKRIKNLLKIEDSTVFRGVDRKK